MAKCCFTIKTTQKQCANNGKYDYESRLFCSTHYKKVSSQLSEKISDSTWSQKIQEIIEGEVAENLDLSYDSIIRNILRKVRIVNNERMLHDIENRDPRLLDKIAERRSKLDEDTANDWTIERYLRKLRDDLMFREEFSIDTSKQCIHERTQLLWLKMRTEKYSTAMKSNGLYLSKEGCLLKRSGRKLGTDTKAFDGSFGDKGPIVCKHTNIEGGSQDNQYQDVMRSIEVAIIWMNKETTDEGYSILCILDGVYYHRNNHKRIRDLRELIPNNLVDRIIITSCQQLSS